MWLKMQNEKDSKEETKGGADGPAESKKPKSHGLVLFMLK
jgi:hypothetical protein